MSHQYQFRPTDEFRARLEHDVLDRHRRGTTRRTAFGDSRGGWMKAASIVAISLVLGASAGFASAQIGRSTERDSLLAAARAEASIANARRDLARAERDDVQKKVSVGILDSRALLQADAELTDAERRRNRLGLDIEEITATGRPPRDDLNAPVVNGRDFVKQRIEVDAMGAQARLRAAESAQGTVDRSVRAGATSDVAALAAALDVAAARSELGVLAKKLALRAEFLKDGTSIDALTQRLDAMQLQQDASVLQLRLNLARARLALVEKQHSLGTVSGEVDLLRARLEVKENELNLQRLVQLMRTKP